MEGDGEGVRHRVRDGDELDVERADHAALAVGDRDQLGAVEQPALLDAALGEPEGQRRSVDRERELAEQVRQRPDVVLVAVGENAALDAVGVLPQEREVREDEVDAGHRLLGEHQPAVDEQQPAGDLEDGAVATDLAEAAEERDLDGLRHRRCRAPR